MALRACLHCRNQRPPQKNCTTSVPRNLLFPHPMSVYHHSPNHGPDTSLPEPLTDEQKTKLASLLDVSALFRSRTYRERSLSIRRYCMIFARNIACYMPGVALPLPSSLPQWSVECGEGAKEDILPLLLVS